MSAASQPVIVPSQQPARPAASREDGYVDFYGHANAAGGWLLCGWSAERWVDEPSAGGVIAQFERGRVVAETLVCWHDRPDLGRSGTGVVVFLRASGRALGELLGLEIRRGPRILRLPSVRPVVHLREPELLARARPLVATGRGPGQARIAALLSRKPYSGVDTLAELPVPVQFEVDETILSPPDGLVLMGWLVDPAEAIASIRVRCGSAASEPIGNRWIRTRRQDVFDAIGARLGMSDARCGFLAFAPGVAGGTGALYVEIELKTGETGYKRLPLPVRRGVPAIRRILEGVELTSDQIERAFDRVLGPALVPINRARLDRPREVTEVAFGTVPDEPTCSVIVPLYGRMDFLLYQVALLSQYPGWASHELIYVLDDPPRRRELLDLAHSAHRRFGFPFRVLLLEENLGFAPANNVGLKHTRGEFVCYLNSDVVPQEPQWLDIMIEDLRADPSLGIVGSLLLFEDGTVQHEGITFERLPQQANWPFPIHPNKGRLPRQDLPDLHAVDAVTGACMVLRRELALDLGGFDESFAIGDFEDSDLCLRIAARGLHCAVDRRARLFHLERQSQVSPDRMWRSYVTLLNAWTHTRRWFPSKDISE